MYRYGSDTNIIYTPEDVILFKESPFACWMERLTLENPDHGIAPDTVSTPKAGRSRLLHNITFRLDAQGQATNAVTWEDFVAGSQSAPTAQAPVQSNRTYAFHVEGSDVFVVDPQADESARRASTLNAMHSGIQFIINGQLATGSLSTRCDLLMRSPGVSELGEYLYLPCMTHPDRAPQARLRLCFAADLLHDLQGELPPQILLMQGGEGLASLQTEDHIYHYREVKHRFMKAQLLFRKHCMPDPMESSHFGRWTACANDLIKRCAVSGRFQEQEKAARESGKVEPLYRSSDETAPRPDPEQHRVEGDKRRPGALDSSLLPNAGTR